ncbi:pectate lyase [Tamlana sp. s12]|uniref:pectate lyase n=1 Tax=Tamlana sp. s12 TaxID=1630406 RepID=UPI0007FE4A27|nr:pectate lyase [Tamlana sp. s12]OBQ52214.1 pectate lyase [Tamlana sp. s12]QQY82323.1 pectate lyase [Tamlana sp. s12]
MRDFKLLFVGFIIVFCQQVQAQVHPKSWSRIVHQDEGAWFASEEAIDIAENVLLYQRDIGGWPKNIQMQKGLSPSEISHLKKLKSSSKDVTTDNGATIQEMLFLSKVYQQVPDPRYKSAFIKGVQYLLKAQYDNGGWPQFYPLRKGYYSHITYNDDSMVNILELLKALKEQSDELSITLSPDLSSRVEEAFNKGIDCILKTQYKQNGVLTAWCAQYDEHSLEPAKARSYELPSLSGKESANIVSLLMSIDKPSSEIINAVNKAVAWFQLVKITNLKRQPIRDKNGKYIDVKMIEDQNADPIWARFMELDDNTPFFCDRDGVKKATLSEIGIERRSGYAWYTDTPRKILAKYPKWKSKYDAKLVKKSAKDPYNMVVAKDGSGDFDNIQDAIYAAKAFPYQRVIIHVKNGLYNEKVHVYSWNTKVTLIGESQEHTIISYNDYFSKTNLGRNSTFHTSTVLIEGDDFIAKNLTIKNSAGPVGQAIALSVNANRCYFENCKLLGFQDTLYTSGEGYKQYFKNCYIEGSTDFIFGEATVLFDACQIHSKTNSYITAASTPQGEDFGYVFKNCKLTADANLDAVYLGRPWRLHAKTVFLYCELGSQILPLGWHNWNKKEAEKTVFYAEYNNSGAGFQPDKRVNWSHQLSKKEAKKYTVDNILGTDFSKNHK